MHDWSIDYAVDEYQHMVDDLCEIRDLIDELRAQTEDVYE